MIFNFIFRYVPFLFLILFILTSSLLLLAVRHFCVLFTFFKNCLLSLLIDLIVSLHSISLLYAFVNIIFSFYFII